MDKILQKFLILAIWLSLSIDKSLSAQSDINDFHYEPVDGKYIGLWPHKDLSGKTDFEYYKKQLGFHFMMVLPRDSSWRLSTEQFENAIAAGYDSSSIMINMRFDNIDYCVENLTALRYYLGEPTEHNCSGDPSNVSLDFVFSPSQLDSVRQKIVAHHPNSEFVIDGYKRCSHLIIASEEADQIMYSSYENWNEISWNCTPDLGWGENPEFAWTNFLTGSNQSDSWEDMRRLFGDKFSMSWMHGEGDEYAELFETASDIGLSSIWLYALNLADSIEGQSYMDTLQLQSFCDNAYDKGWLIKVYDIDFPPPFNILGQEIEIGVIDLSWEDSTDYAIGYVIEKKASADTSFNLLDSLDSSSNSYLDSNVVENQTYDYRIYSYTDARNSMYSDTVSITTSVRSVTAPSDLQAEFENNLVMLTWQDNSDNEDNFFIERKLNDSGVFNLIDSTEMDAVQYTDSSIAADGIYQYRIFAGNEFTRSENSDTVEIIIAITGVEDLTKRFTFNLSQNYPNPFNTSTVIEYSIPETSELAYSEAVNSRQYTVGSNKQKKSQSTNHPIYPGVVKRSRINQSNTNLVSIQLKVFDVLGREVATLVNEHQRPGSYQVNFNAEALSSGMYYYSLSVNGNVTTKKMILLR